MNVYENNVYDHGRSRRMNVSCFYCCFIRVPYEDWVAFLVKGDETAIVLSGLVNRVCTGDGYDKLGMISWGYFV